jgi:hypothetical protein
MNTVLKLLLDELEKNPQLIEEVVTVLLNLFVAKPALLQKAVEVTVNKMAVSGTAPTKNV